MPSLDWGQAAWRGMELKFAELELWRKRYPHMVETVSEEARAKVDGDKLNYPAPIPIG